MKKNSETAKMELWNFTKFNHSQFSSKKSTYASPRKELEIPWVKEWVSRTKQVNEIYKP